MELVLGEAVRGVRPLLLPAEFGVCGLEVDGVNDLQENSKLNKLVLRLRQDPNTYKESNLSMSAWEYEAPTTIFGSEPLEEPFLVIEGRLRQKADVDLLAICQQLSHFSCGLWE